MRVLTLAYIADDLGVWLRDSGLSTFAVTIMALAFVSVVVIIATYFLTKAI